MIRHWTVMAARYYIGILNPCFVSCVYIFICFFSLSICALSNAIINGCFRIGPHLLHRCHTFCRPFNLSISPFIGTSYRVFLWFLYVFRFHKFRVIQSTGVFHYTQFLLRAPLCFWFGLRFVFTPPPFYILFSCIQLSS